MQCYAGVTNRMTQDMEADDEHDNWRRIGQVRCVCEISCGVHVRDCEADRELKKSIEENVESVLNC